jgi:integrase
VGRQVGAFGQVLANQAVGVLVRSALPGGVRVAEVDREAFGRAWQDTGLVFTTRSGLPIEPRNLARSFRRICDRNNIRVIKVHHLRHSTASLLKKLRAAPRDAQMILGHAHTSTHDADLHPRRSGIPRRCAGQSQQAARRRSVRC